MGNNQHSQHDDFKKMISDMRKQQSRKLNINPQKKYLALMKDALNSSKLPETLKIIIKDTLQNKVNSVELIQTVSSISCLKKNEFENHANRLPSALKERPQSKFVKVRFDQGFLQKILRHFQEGHHIDRSSSQENNSCSSPVKPHPPSSKIKSAQQIQSQENERKQKLKNIAPVMKKQLNRIMHPFGKLNKAFAQYIQSRYHQFIPKKCSEDVYERTVSKLINEWCLYLQNSCLLPYKKWIMNYTELQQKRYAAWIRSLLIQQIWIVNNGYLFSMLTIIIQRCKEPLQIDFKTLQQSASILTPSFFSIDKKLQIEGHFFDSIYQMSQIVNRYKPQQVLTQLQTVKKRVCTDIDNYHRLVQLGKVYQIDSDNILGIVAYILCKIESKIQEIHTQLIFLRIIYGEKVYFSMGLGSYMLSTIFGALEFLESQHFRSLITEKKEKKTALKVQQHKDGSETKFSSAFRGSVEEGSHSGGKDNFMNSLLSQQ